MHEDQLISPPLTWEYLAVNTNYGLGSGKIKGSERRKYKVISLYEQFKKDEKRCSNMIHINLNELEEITKGINVCNSRIKIPLIDKVIIGLLFVIKYYSVRHISEIVNTSIFTISKCLDEILPHLSYYFISFIPDSIEGELYPKSTLSDKIIAIVDNTIHKIRKPSSKQNLFYNGHYKMHGILSQLLVDFSARVIGFITNVPGKVHDSLVAVYANNFRDILGKNLALGDPGFASVDWIVCGLRRNQIKSPGCMLFDKISRKEQVLIENVNKFIKDCRSVDKDCAFYHGTKKLLFCIVIAIGLYNRKLEWGYFHRINP